MQKDCSNKEAASPQLSDFLAKTDVDIISNLAHVQIILAPRPRSVWSVAPLFCQAPKIAENDIAMQEQRLLSG